MAASCPGLLFYNARYYDPAIGRFISSDTVVPGNASGGMEGVALRPLTVAFHEPGFIATLNGEGAQADKLHWGGPVNPQALNRYAYVNNNPMRWTDPSGHDRVEGVADNGSIVGDGQIYGYQEVRDSSGAPVMQNGEMLYDAYICNLAHTSCSVGQIGENDPDFKLFRKHVDRIVETNRQAMTLLTGAVVTTTAGIVACVFSIGLGCVAAAGSLAASGAAATYIKQQEWEAAASAKKHFNGLWRRAISKLVNAPLPVYAYPNDSPAPWFP